ncbi:hypothetical protein AB0383_25250 [Amycolatopsis sp. NPDC051373]|uniref:hypothetical protein n=1 Tax=Amycolatopsis sp. NPDC051373 TaxID=3155801 RepID=UPI003450BBDF
MTSASNFEGSPVPASGDPTQEAIPDLVVNPLDTEGVKRLNDNATKFKALAEQGGFAINEAGFDAYNRVCNEFIDGYGGMAVKFGTLATRAKMGSSDYANQVADFNIKIANGDEQSLIPNLELLRKSILQVQDALKIAKANYRAADSEHAQTFSGIGKADS